VLSLSLQLQFAVAILVFIKKTVGSKFNLLATVFSFTVVFKVLKFRKMRLFALKVIVP
jgi:hypothetical protein